MVREYLTKIVIMASCAFSIWGCAATRHIANPSTPPPDLNLVGVAEDIEVKLHHVIVPDGPGSWVQGAKWTEWVVSITNRGQGDLAIGRINLVDSSGVYVDSGRVSPWGLEAGSDAVSSLARSAGTTLGLGTAEMMVGLVCPFCAPVIGVGIVGAPYAQLYSEAKDREAIHAEFGRRRLPSPLRLGVGGSLRGSIFFPIVSQPRALVMTYRAPGGEGQMKLTLETALNPAQVQFEKLEPQSPPSVVQWP